MRHHFALAAACAALFATAVPARANLVTYQFNHASATAPIGLYRNSAVVDITGLLTIDTTTNAVLNGSPYGGTSKDFQLQIALDGSPDGAATPLYNDLTDTLYFTFQYVHAYITFDGSLDTIGSGFVTAESYPDDYVPSVATSFSGDISVYANVGTVPEPATLALLGAGIAALGLVRRRTARRLA